MADTHAYFLGFEAAVSPSTRELERSLQIRGSLRAAIAEDCVQQGWSIAFHPQGSFRLLTAVRRDGLDLDDGVLFRAADFTTTPSIEWLHAFVFRSLRRRGHAVVARLPCLRVLCPRGVRVDTVVYLEHGDGRVCLAHRKDGWVPAHSSHLISWLENQPNGAGQVRRMVKYYKMWAARAVPALMPSGVVFTILIRNLLQPAPRDDVSLVQTMERISAHLEAGHGCRRPTPPVGQELLHTELTAVELEQCLGRLRDLIRVGREALGTDDVEGAVKLWQTQFGPRFGALLAPVSAAARALQLRRVLGDVADAAADRTSARPVSATAAEEGAIAAEPGGFSWTL